MNRTMTLFVFIAVFTAGASAQIMKGSDAIPNPAKVQGGGAVVPWLTFGIQTTEALGYNLQTGASGLGYATTNDHPDVATSAWFSVALLDGVTDAPLAFQTAEDSKDWKTTFTFKNFSARINTNTSPTLEMVKPSWKAEVRGQGFRFGLLSQGGRDIGTGKDNNPSMTLTGANQVLNLSGADAASRDYITASSGQTVVFKGTANESGLVYAGYESKGLLSTYLTVFAEGNVGSNMNPTGAAKAQGWALAWEGTATPAGTASESQPLAYTVKADVLKGFGFQSTSANPNTNNPGGNTGGLGLAGQVDWWLGNALVLSPTAAYDGRWNDIKVAGHLADYEWEAGGGLLLQVGEAKFTNDDWNELKDLRDTLSYVTPKIRKVAYLQLLGMSSDATDLDLAFKAEEPDGLLGLDPNLGAMVEYRLNNLRQLAGASTQWSAVGRVSYEAADHSIVPYLRFSASGPGLASVDKSSVLKLRAGVQLAVVPGFGLEAAYLSPQLLTGATAAKDTGKLELIATFKTDGEPKKVFTPKTMYFEDWNK